MECLSIIKEHIGINILFVVIYNISKIGASQLSLVIYDN